MTDDERLDHRHPPKLAPMPQPIRFSQTLLANAERCRRSAYLYVRHHGGMPSHPLDRGSAYHLAKARCITVMLEQNEPSIPADVAKAILEEILDEHPEFTIPLSDVDDLREMIYHFSIGHTIDPQALVAVERKFVLELAGGFTLSGIIDEAEIHGAVGRIRDDKTQWALPPAEEYASSFQCRFYAVLLMFGNPVTERRCLNCTFDDAYSIREPLVLCSEACTGKIVDLEPCLGDHLTWVDVGEQYPRFLHDEKLAERAVGMSRLEVQEARTDIERLCRHLGHSFTSGEWPAVPGSHCARCPCEPECPLPRELRQFAGAINTVEEAQEAAMWVEKWKPRIAATTKEIKLWATQNGPFRFGRDREFVFVEQTATTTDWPALDEAVEAARTFGTPFHADEYRRRRMHTRFVARTVGRASEEEAPES